MPQPITATFKIDAGNGGNGGKMFSGESPPDDGAGLGAVADGAVAVGGGGAIGEYSGGDVPLDDGDAPEGELTTPGSGSAVNADPGDIVEDVAHDMALVGHGTGVTLDDGGGFG